MGSYTTASSQKLCIQMRERERERSILSSGNGLSLNRRDDDVELFLENY